MVEMNWKAIDAGFDAYHKVEVPASWKDAQDAPVAHDLAGNPATVDMVTKVMFPVGKMDGDSLPVSAFEKYVDGQFEQGASAYEKRGVAVSVPEWDVTEDCIQCNQCAYVCPHATIRPFALSAEEVAAAPEALKAKKMNGKGCEEYQFAMTVSPLDCMGCGVCVERVPGPQGKQGAEDGAAGERSLPSRMCSITAVANVSQEARHDAAETTVKGSQFNQPLLEFSGSLRRLRRDQLCPPDHPAVRRAHVYFQRHRLLLHLGRPGCNVPLHAQPASAATARPGRTACLRTTPSTASACTWARRRCATTWRKRPAG